MSYFKYIENPEIASVNDYNLYHTTTPYKAEKILKENLLRLSLQETNSSEHQGKRPLRLYYMSFARTPSSGYIADRSSGLRKVNEVVLFIFDERKLKKIRGVIIKPTNYWNSDRPDYTSGVGASGRIMGSSKEAEERLFSNSLELKNTNKAIKEIRIFLYDRDLENDGQLWAVRKLYLEAKLNKIPMKFFKENNLQGYLHGRENKKDREEILTLVKQTMKDIYFLQRSPSRISDSFNSKIVKKKWPSAWAGDRGMLNELRYLVKSKSYEELPTKVRSGLYYHLRYPDSFKLHYQADIHNMRAGYTKDKQEFDKLLKATKVKSVAEFFEYLYNKWTKLRQEYIDNDKNN